MKCSVLLAWCIVISFNVIGQSSFITLSGKVIDAQTQQSIPFASIYLKAKSTGTISNTAGEFILKIQQTSLRDTLVISSVGYKTVSIPIPERDRTSLAIYLVPAAVTLNEVTVDAETGLSIIKKALAKASVNYDTATVQLTAFYRENIWLADEELTYNESVLDIYKVERATDKFTDQIRIIKGRKKDIPHSQDIQFYYWMSNISNGARGSLGDDLIQYRLLRLNPLNPENFRYYIYEYTETIHEDDRDLIIVNVMPKERARKAILKLKFFIDEESLAFVRIDYQLSPQGVKYINRHGKGGIAYTIMSKVIRARLDFKQINYTIHYKPYRGKWYLSSIQRHWDVVVNSGKRKMKDRPWTADMSLTITDVNTDSVKSFQEGNIGSNLSSMNNLVSKDADETFWENYNIVKPVLPDSLRQTENIAPPKNKPTIRVSNRQNGFTRADTLRGKLSPLRTCYDVTFYHLDVAVNLDKQSVKGSNAIRFTVTEPFRQMQVDLYANMHINQILYRGQPLPYTREYNAVFITMPREMKTGSQEEITLYYEGIPQTPDFSIPMYGGVLWDKDSLGNPWAQVVCQGSGASLWWPNKDHLSDEPDSMKIWITVPEKYTEISNGRLIRKTPMPNQQTRFEWYVSYPINNYNVTFSIGLYEHWEDYYIQQQNDTLTIDYYAMPYNAKRAREMFRQVKPMLQCYEKYFGKYPFPRDGFTLLESLYPMEHQSGVCIGKITAANASDTNPLLWHESAHEWWGNAISCKDLADMWIHEAFATYAEALVIDYRFGEEEALLEMQKQRDHVSNKEPVTGIYDVNHIYYDIGDMYSKGSLMLNTFRYALNNDSLWINLLRNIQSHFRYQTLSANDLIGFINQYTCSDYTYFFRQYLQYTTIPTLEVKLQQKGADLLVTYRWQADVENFQMPVRITTSPDRFTYIYPTTQWKSMTLKNMPAESFEADEERFYINTQITDN
ncbi:MAG TPA: carboxypeptidase-like regulatory domain-containing protein [Ohtaekwangia sp.]|uniref:carboxypeptidase-like regulatory domain-containing protein n=1 Tax=Ohtaekwangia sp. TaxID=2066019 RepID=UPI002F95611A